MSRKPTDGPRTDLELSEEPEGIDARCFEQVAASVAPSSVTAEMRERLWTQIRARVATLEPAGTTTARADGAEWIALSPLVRFRRLRLDIVAGSQTILVRAEPGGRLPRHQHHQDEEFIVLEGECQIGSHHLRAGDAHFAPAGSWHEEIVTQTGVLVLVRGEYRPSVLV
jgi:quercetin dioxygenase-like cupin family protein